MDQGYGRFIRILIDRYFSIYKKIMDSRPNRPLLNAVEDHNRLEKQTQMYKVTEIKRLRNNIKLQLHMCAIKKYRKITL